MKVNSINLLMQKQTVKTCSRGHKFQKLSDCLTQLAKYSELEIADLHGMGPKALGMLKIALRKKDLLFKPTLKSL